MYSYLENKKIYIIVTDYFLFQTFENFGFVPQHFTWQYRIVKKKHAFRLIHLYQIENFYTLYYDDDDDTA